MNRRITVIDDHNPPTALCPVEVSDISDPVARREEHVLFGREALEDCFWAVAGVYPEIDKPQPILLLATKFLVKALNDGKRDERLESDITVAWIRHNGMLGLEVLFSRYNTKRANATEALARIRGA